MKEIKVKLKESAKRAYRILVTPLLIRELSSRRGSSPVYDQVADAITWTLRDITTLEERMWINKVEALRKKLLNSTERINITDYGAGFSESTLTKEEMHEGRLFVKSVGEVCRKTCGPYFWHLLLFRIIRGFKPFMCLEMGTCLGLSASFQAAALNLNEKGRLITLEGDKTYAQIAAGNLDFLGLDNASVVVGRFEDTLSGVLNVYGPFDYAFIDGHHDERATIEYFHLISLSLASPAVLVFDDISWSPGMKRAWKIITSDKGIGMSIDLSTVGICIVDRNIQSSGTIRIHPVH